MLDSDRREPTGWEIAIATNAALKGLLGAMGQSGHVCREAIPVSVLLDLHSGHESVTEQILAAVTPLVRPGDTIVVAEKVVAVAQGRIGPARILTEPDPKTISAPERAVIADRVSRELEMPVSSLHLLLADEYRHPDGTLLATLGCEDHNQAAADLAAAVRQRLNVAVDVVISDTDTGLDVRAPLIGTVTFGATPLGATAGLSLYECMRCACAAEFVRGHDRGIPVVVCRPAHRCADRPALGVYRGYPGALERDRESLAHD